MHEERWIDIALLVEHDKPGEPCADCRGTGQISYEGFISGQWSEPCEDCKGTGTNTLELCESRGRAISDLLKECKRLQAERDDALRLRDQAVALSPKDRLIVGAALLGSVSMEEARETVGRMKSILESVAAGCEWHGSEANRSHPIRNVAMAALGPCPVDSGECAIRRACTNKCGRLTP
jgi:hypothetical protein